MRQNEQAKRQNKKADRKIKSQETKNILSMTLVQITEGKNQQGI